MKIARSLRNHRELILNYFRAQELLASGVVEGLNNKAKVTMRKSYGFRPYYTFELALYHAVVPESTHNFFHEPKKEARNICGPRTRSFPTSSASWRTGTAVDRRPKSPARRW